MPSVSVVRKTILAGVFYLTSSDGFWSMFTIFIQIGAIAAVVVYFRARLLELLRGQPERRLTPLEISQSATAAAAVSTIATIA